MKQRTHDNQVDCSRDRNRVSVIAVLTPVQNLLMHGTDWACVMRIDCPHCGKQKIVYKPDGAGDFDLFCFGEWVPISIETVI